MDMDLSSKHLSCPVCFSAESLQGSRAGSFIFLFPLPRSARGGSSSHGRGADEVRGREVPRGALPTWRTCRSRTRTHSTSELARHVSAPPRYASRSPASLTRQAARSEPAAAAVACVGTHGHDRDPMDPHTKLSLSPDRSRLALCRFVPTLTMTLRVCCADLGAHV